MATKVIAEATEHPGSYKDELIGRRNRTEKIWDTASRVVFVVANKS